MALMAAAAAPALLRRLADTLGPPLVVLKGPAIAARYRSAGERAYRDVDVLVPDTAAAQRRMLAAGAELVDPDAAAPDDGHHEAELCVPGNPLVIELHDHPRWAPWAPGPRAEEPPVGRDRAVAGRGVHPAAGRARRRDRGPLVVASPAAAGARPPRRRGAPRVRRRRGTPPPPRVAGTWNGCGSSPPPRSTRSSADEPARGPCARGRATFPTCGDAAWRRRPSSMPPPRSRSCPQAPASAAALGELRRAVARRLPGAARQRRDDPLSRAAQ